jgi:hypothetical protein
MVDYGMSNDELQTAIIVTSLMLEGHDNQGCFGIVITEHLKSLLEVQILRARYIFEDV